MYKVTIGLTAAVLLICSAIGWTTAQEGKANKKEAKKLQGTWTANKDGKKAVMKFKGTKFTFTMGDGNKSATASGTFTIDPSKSPKAIDLKITKGEGEPVQNFIGKTSLGIYKLDGDSLTWCAAEPGSENRPTSLTDDGGNHLLLMFERKKK